MYKTRNGALCVPLGPRRYSETTPATFGTAIPKVQYLQCQMMPADPQRIEWIREDNLIPVEG